MEQFDLDAAVTAFQCGDTEMFSIIYQVIYEKMYGFALLRLSHHAMDAEDAVQEAFVEIYNRIGTLQETRAFRKWALTILARICSHKASKYHREQLLEDETMLENRESDDLEFLPGALLEQNDSHDTVLQILDELPGMQREVLTMRYFLDMPLEDMSHVLNIPLGTVKSRLNHAKLSMRERVERWQNKGVVVWGVAPAFVLGEILKKSVSQASSHSINQVWVGVTQKVGMGVSATRAMSGLAAARPDLYTAAKTSVQKSVVSSPLSGGTRVAKASASLGRAALSNASSASGAAAGAGAAGASGAVAGTGAAGAAAAGTAAAISGKAVGIVVAAALATVGGVGAIVAVDTALPTEQPSVSAAAETSPTPASAGFLEQINDAFAISDQNASDLAPSAVTPKADPHVTPTPSALPVTELQSNEIDAICAIGSVVGTFHIADANALTEHDVENILYLYANLGQKLHRMDGNDLPCPYNEEYSMPIPAAEAVIQRLFGVPYSIVRNHDSGYGYYTNDTTVFIPSGDPELTVGKINYTALADNTYYIEYFFDDYEIDDYFYGGMMLVKRSAETPYGFYVLSVDTVYGE